MTFFEWVMAKKDLRLTPYQIKMVETVSDGGPDRLFLSGHRHSKAMIAKLYMQYQRDVNDKTTLQPSPISPPPQETLLPAPGSNILSGTFAPRLSIVSTQTGKNGLRLRDVQNDDPGDSSEE